jgi:hypothetical protein
MLRGLLPPATVCSQQIAGSGYRFGMAAPMT